jgi:ABC-type Fe3+-hydroxamate transport system substrate-binding protein
VLSSCRPRSAGDLSAGGIRCLRGEATASAAMELEDAPCGSGTLPRALVLTVLAAGGAVVGRSASATVVPADASALPVIDSTEALVKLGPDLLVSHPNHHRFPPQALEPLGILLLLLQHRSVAEVLDGMVLLGAATGRMQAGGDLRTALQARIQALSADNRGPRPRVLLLFGTARAFPAMGEETYAGDLLRLAGSQNVAAHLPHNPARAAFCRSPWS